MVLIGLLVGVLFIMRHGYVRLAAVITVVGCWAILTVAAYTSEGMRAPAIGGYLIVVLCAGLLLGQRAAVAAAAVCALTSLGFVYAARAGGLPAADSIHSDTSIWIANTVYLVVAAALLSRAIDSINRALSRARRELAERTQAESALRESEARYRFLYTKTPAMLHSIDRDGRLISVSDNWLDTLGYRRDEVLGRRSTDFLTEESRAYARNVVLPEYYARGFCKEIPYRFVKKNGETIDVLLSAIAEREADGAIIRSLAILIDVTERKRAEQALQETEERYRLVSELVSDYAFSYQVAADGAITLDWVTDAMTRITGYSLEEIRAPDYWQATTYPEDLPIARQRRQRLHAGLADISEYCIVAKDGRILWLRYYSRPVWNATHSRVERVYGAVQDVTKLKQLEQQLGQSQKLEAVGRLAGGIAHDFNNILTIILSNSTLALEVLRRQPESVQSFLLQTAMLERLSGSLCDAVLGRADSEMMLEQLARANLFLIPLDDQGYWYRYHHLFVDLLLHYLHRTASPFAGLLARELKGGVSNLHRRAAAWYEKAGLAEDAIHHALAAQEFAWAGRLILGHAEGTLARGEVSLLLRWLQALPESWLRSQLQLQLLEAGLLFLTGQFDEIQQRLPHIEQAWNLHQIEATEWQGLFSDQEIPGLIAALQAEIALFHGEIPRALPLFEQALAQLDRDILGLRSVMGHHIALYYWPRSAAEQGTALAAGYGAARAQADDLSTLMALGQRAAMKRRHGQCRQSIALLRQIVHMAAESARPAPLPIIGLAHGELSLLLYETNDLGFWRCSAWPPRR